MADEKSDTTINSIVKKILLLLFKHFLLVEDLYMSLYAIHLGQIISTVLGQVDHDGQHGNAA